MNCFDGNGDGWGWEGWRLRLLAALAEECALLGQAIARLGGQVSAGDADMMALQDFDAQAQTAAALAGVLEQLGDSRHRIVRRLAGVPLPAMRRRLCAALNPDRAEYGPGGEAQGDIVWLDGP